MDSLCPSCKNYQSKLCDSCVHNIPMLLTVPVKVVAMDNAPHEGPGAALSRTVPLDAVVGPQTEAENGHRE